MITDIEDWDNCISIIADVAEVADIAERTGLADIADVAGLCRTIYGGWRCGGRWERSGLWKCVWSVAYVEGGMS